MATLTETVTSQDPLSDEEVVARVLAGETSMFEIVMRRYNQRLYRVARAILRNDSEAEDVMQDAYVRAYEHLDQFAGRAKFSTWLTRIAVHEALTRRRRASIERGRCCAKVCTLVQEWNGKRRSISMPFGVTEL